MDSIAEKLSALVYIKKEKLIDEETYLYIFTKIESEIHSVWSKPSPARYEVDITDAIDALFILKDLFYNENCYLKLCSLVKEQFDTLPESDSEDEQADVEIIFHYGKFYLYKKETHEFFTCPDHILQGGGNDGHSWRIIDPLRTEPEYYAPLTKTPNTMWSPATGLVGLTAVPSF